MTDSFPMPIDPPAPIDGQRHQLPITFSGSGSEYFRIWLVNLLLTLVTLGLYHPWAKVRRLRYFYGNTSVGGHALDFHGSPSRMLRGFLLVGAMVVLYSVAGKVSPLAGLIAFLIVAAIWPALFRASQQFRLANTSWRGLRFRFDGDLPGACRAMLPLFVPGAISLLGVLLGDVDADGEPGLPLLVKLAGAAVLLLFPYFFWSLKKYQHDHFALGQVQTALRVGPGSFYLLALKAVGVMLAVGVGVGIVAGISVGATLVAMVKDNVGQGATAGAVAAIVVIVLAVYFAMILVIVPFVTSRMQNLVWSGTASPLIEFGSRLRFGPLLWLTLKNWLLVLLTLGLYFPFAKIAMTRLRLAAMSVSTLVAPDELLGSLRTGADDATGDAAGDLFGIDIGL